jgi:hypothetical protein
MPGRHECMIPNINTRLPPLVPYKLYSTENVVCHLSHVAGSFLLHSWLTTGPLRHSQYVGKKLISLGEPLMEENGATTALPMFGGELILLAGFFWRAPQEGAESVSRT